MTTIKIDEITDEQKINAVKEFILNTYNAHGKDTIKIFEKDIPREITWSEFIAILCSNKIRKLDKREMKIITGEKVSDAEMEWNRMGIVDELIESGAKKLCAIEDKEDVYERAAKICKKWFE